MFRRVLVLVVPLLVAVGLLAAPATAEDPTPVPTTTTLAISGPFSHPYGEPVTVTATVTSPAGTPTGTVTFSDDLGEVFAADVPLDAAGTASVTFQVEPDTRGRVLAAFTGTGGYGDSSAQLTFAKQPALVVVDPEPTVARLAPNFTLTLTMAAHVHDTHGTPLAGHTVSFSLLGPMEMFDRDGGYLPMCQATTDADGFATCRGSGTLGALLSIVLGGSYATHWPTSYYGYDWAQAPVITG
jgi:hypothetical protein